MNKGVPMLGSHTNVNVTGAVNRLILKENIKSVAALNVKKVIMVNAMKTVNLKAKCQDCNKIPIVAIKQPLGKVICMPCLLNRLLPVKMEEVQNV